MGQKFLWFDLGIGIVFSLFFFGLSFIYPLNQVIAVVLLWVFGLVLSLGISLIRKRFLITLGYLGGFAMAGLMAGGFPWPDSMEEPKVIPGSEATLTVTERELVFHRKDTAYGSPGLVLDVDGPMDLSDEKLLSLGFHADWLKRGIYESKRVYGVLEYNGPIFRKWFGHGTDEWVFRTQSRLFPVDVGLDPIALRKKYPNPNRYAIVLAAMELYYEDYGPDVKVGDTRCNYFRMLNNRFPMEGDVQIFFRGMEPTVNKMAEPIPIPRWEPRYQATILFGKDYVPNIKNLRLINALKPSTK